MSGGPREATRVRDLLRDAERVLLEAGVSSPRTDAEVLLAHALGLSRTEIYARDRPLEEREVAHVRELLARRLDREPLAYIIGEWGFRRLMLAVDSRVLVPRPETESLVERCLVRLEGIARPRVLDVGTGSGAIALAIADERPDARVTAVDASPNALAVARANTERIGLGDRVRLLRGDLLAGLSGPFDLVASNPPYVSPEEIAALEPEVRDWEPRLAILGSGVGEAIARAALDVLAPDRWLVLECGAGQARALSAQLEGFGYADVATTADLGGRDCIVEARRS